MNSFKLLIQNKFRQISKIFSHSKKDLGFHKLRNFYSEYLSREVKVNIYLPPNYDAALTHRYPVIIFNDGQDMEAIKMAETLEGLYRSDKIQKIIVAAVHAGNRMQEYGTAIQPDYMGRGSKANIYSDFIVKELVPYIHTNYRCLINPRYTAFAGFSLGGLSAMDIAWNHPDIFGKVGIFSGSFWWRSRAFNERDPDADRIIIDILNNSSKKEGMKFWFQTGTEDEKSDRNNNGVIDAIDDTLDVIKILESMGYNQQHDIKYIEVQGGQHNQDTWGKIMPNFLTWVFGKRV